MKNDGLSHLVSRTLHRNDYVNPITYSQSVYGFSDGWSHQSDGDAFDLFFQVMFDDVNENLSESDIRKAINQLKLGDTRPCIERPWLKLGKSCGPDNLVNEIFRYGMDK